MPSLRYQLPIEPLSADAFRPYGDFFEAREAAPHFAINRGDAVRYHDLCNLDVSEGGAGPIVSIFRALPHALPLRLSIMERHLLGSQLFMPLSPHPYLVVVAFAGAPPDPAQLRCFQAAPGQGINYARGTWHHPLLAFETTCDFLVIDRGGRDLPADCEEHSLEPAQVWIERNGVAVMPSSG
jgi:ureidoglycolate lyase